LLLIGFGTVVTASPEEGEEEEEDLKNLGEDGTGGNSISPGADPLGRMDLWV
jgi:hypothetical protein